MATVTVDISL